MKRYLTLGLFFLFITCKVVPIEKRKPIISIKRTACYGQCPVYSIKIFSNGNAIYNGQQFVKENGVVNFSVKKREIDSILNKADEIKFFKMKEKYTAPITDLPSCFVIIKGKKVEDYYNSPNELKELQQMIDDVFFKEN